MFKATYRWTSVEGGAHTRFTDSLDIHASTNHPWAPPLAFSDTALQTQQCDQNMQRNNLQFQHETATHVLLSYDYSMWRWLVNMEYSLVLVVSGCRGDDLLSRWSWLLWKKTSALTIASEAQVWTCQKQFYYARLSTTCTDIRQFYLEFDVNVCVHVIYVIQFVPCVWHNCVRTCMHTSAHVCVWVCVCACGGCAYMCLWPHKCMVWGGGERKEGQCNLLIKV